MLFWWKLAGPLRAYVRWSPISLGKGFLSNRLLAPLLPEPPAEFEAKLPVGGFIRLQYREAVGLSWLLHGTFERSELMFAFSAATPGTAAFDVGAHVGLYTVALARAVGIDGKVLAIEPARANVLRLKENIVRNGLENVDVHAVAAAHFEKSVRLRIATDPAYGSTSEVFEGRDSGDSAFVRGMPLDLVWRSAGRPQVSFVKIDVEGSEVDVVSGATELLALCRPFVLIEAASGAARDSLDAQLGKQGFRHRVVDGFMPWNRLYECSRPQASERSAD